MINLLCITKPPRHTGHTSNDGGSLVSRSSYIQTAIQTARTTAGIALSVVLRLLRSHNARSIAGAAAVCLGITVQVGLCFTAMYLIDLGISLMGLWADLARKHLELTL